MFKMETTNYLLAIVVYLLSTCSVTNNQSINDIRNSYKFSETQIPDNLEDILVTKYFNNNNFERIIAFKDLYAKETKIIMLRNSFRQWEVSDGISLLQLVYSNNNQLVNCTYFRQKDVANKFISDLLREIEFLKTENITYAKWQLNINNYKNFTTFTENRIFYDFDHTPDIISLNDNLHIRNINFISIKNMSDIPNDIKPGLNLTSLKLECHKIQVLRNLPYDSDYKNIQKGSISGDYFKRKKRSLSDLLIAPNTKWCGRGHNADNYNELGGASQADKCCRKHDHCRSNIQGMSTKWNLFNFRMYTISHCNCDIRFRRDLSRLLRIPGTKWCGKGWDAKRYSDLGGYSKVDRCCRQHDKSCLFWIMGFETKYNFYNWRVNTLMHCKCDERFRTCLKMADTADANLVGKLFFNVVQTKCFVIKWEKVCKKRSTDGKCEKKILRKKAHLRENRKF